MTSPSSSNCDDGFSDFPHRPAHAAISDDGLDRLFRNARTHHHFTGDTLSDVQLMALYDLVKMGPTSANIQPSRFKFLRSQEAKDRLGPLMAEGNRDKVKHAPVVVIIGYDMAFYENMGKVFPHNPGARSWFEGAPDLEVTALRNSSLQGGYFILAARSLGLDCGPMSGFDGAAVDRAFWADSRVKTNFISTLGYGDPEKLHPRLPRLSFDDACTML